MMKFKRWKKMIVMLLIATMFFQSVVVYADDGTSTMPSQTITSDAQTAAKEESTTSQTPPGGKGDADDPADPGGKGDADDPDDSDGKGNADNPADPGGKGDVDDPADPGGKDDGEGSKEVTESVDNGGNGVDTDGGTEEETQETEPVNDEVPEEVKAFLEAVAKLPAPEDVTKENAEEIGEQVNAVLDMAEALSDENYAREDVGEALTIAYDVMEAVLAAEKIEKISAYATEGASAIGYWCPGANSNSNRGYAKYLHNYEPWVGEVFYRAAYTNYIGHNFKYPDGSFTLDGELDSNGIGDKFVDSGPIGIWSKPLNSVNFSAGTYGYACKFNYVEVNGTRIANGGSVDLENTRVVVSWDEPSKDEKNPPNIRAEFIQITEGASSDYVDIKVGFDYWISMNGGEGSTGHYTHFIYNESNKGKQKPNKPTKDEMDDIQVKITCVDAAGTENSKCGSETLKLVDYEGNYTVSNVVKNPGTKYSASVYPYMCTITLDNEAWKNTFVSIKNSATPHSIHSKTDTVTKEFYWGSGSWYYEKPKLMNIYVTEASTTYRTIREYYVGGEKVACVVSGENKAKVGDVLVGADIAGANKGWVNYTTDGISYEYEYKGSYEGNFTTNTFTSNAYERGKEAGSVTLTDNLKTNVIILRYERETTPSAPTKKEAENILSGKYTVKVKCTNENREHTLAEKDYSITAADITSISEVKKNASDKWEVEVCSTNNTFIDKFNDEINVNCKHDEKSGGFSTKLVWNGSTWTYENISYTRTIETECHPETSKTITYTVVYKTYDSEKSEVSNLPASETKQGTAPGSVDFTVSSQIPTRDGYEFAGWAVQGTTKNGGDTLTVTGSASANSVTENLYATWTKKPDAPVIPGDKGKLRVQVVCDSEESGHVGKKEKLRLRTVQNGITEYTDGKVVKTNKDGYDWEYTVTLYKSDFADRFKHNDNDHEYVENTKDTVNVTFYYKNGEWDYANFKNHNSSVEIVYEKNGSDDYFCNYVVYHVEPKMSTGTPKIEVKKSNTNFRVDSESGNAKVDYTVTIKNVSGFDIYGLRLTDTLTPTPTKTGIGEGTPEATYTFSNWKVDKENITPISGSATDKIHVLQLIERNTKFTNEQTVTLTYTVEIENTGKVDADVHLENEAEGAAWSNAPSGQKSVAKAFAAMFRGSIISLFDDDDDPPDVTGSGSSSATTETDPPDVTDKDTSEAGGNTGGSSTEGTLPAKYTLTYDWNLPEGANPAKTLPTDTRNSRPAGSHFTVDTVNKEGDEVTGSDGKTYVFSGWQVPDGVATEENEGEYKGQYVMPAHAVVIKGEWTLKEDVPEKPTIEDLQQVGVVVKCSDDSKHDSGTGWWQLGGELKDGNLYPWYDEWRTIGEVTKVGDTYQCIVTLHAVPWANLRINGQTLTNIKKNKGIGHIFDEEKTGGKEILVTFTYEDGAWTADKKVAEVWLKEDIVKKNVDIFKAFYGPSKDEVERIKDNFSITYTYKLNGKTTTGTLNGRDAEFVEGGGLFSGCEAVMKWTVEFEMNNGSTKDSGAGEISFTETGKEIDGWTWYNIDETLTDIPNANLSGFSHPQFIADGHKSIGLSNDYEQDDMVTITVRFVDEEGNVVNSVTVENVKKGSEYDVTEETEKIPDGYEKNGEPMGDSVSGTADTNKTIIVPVKTIMYTVTYTDGVNGAAFADQVTTGLKEGVMTPAFSGTPSRSGYTFAGWTPTVADTVTGNAIYTAQWTLIPENPTTPTTPSGGGGGGRTPDPTPTPPVPEITPLIPEIIPAGGPTPVVPTVTPVAATPAAPTPTAALVSPTPEAVELADEAVPLAAEEEKQPEMEVVDEEETPLAGGKGAAWALINFALMNLAIFESVMLLIGYFVKTKNDEEEEKRKLKKKGIFRIISLPIAIISLIVFILTEDITLPTAFVDKYTIVMLIIAIVQTVMVALSNKKYEDEDEQEV